MKKVYFCNVCRKVFHEENACTCEANDIKQVKLGTPVNVIGTKLKGKVYRIKNDVLELVITSSKDRYIKPCKLEDVRKII
ncbi:hypothetical protein [Niameybacter massiliensis]|uniref:hypothetical protein n=1 Tax=Niameybacter massiliensis TaxID=1658108 RepID=UPI0006B4B49F|nr:hypothetical protein [Niameybacter massiliensis]